MPFVVRLVEPKSVCAKPLLSEDATWRGDALGAVTVRSLAGIIRQLGSLARHAESLMGEIAESLALVHARTIALEERARVLMSSSLPALDPDREGRWGGTRNGVRGVCVRLGFTLSS